MEAPQETVNTLAPENLPPPIPALPEAAAKRKRFYTPLGANITDEQREAALEKVIAGADLKTTAQALLVSPKSIRNWYMNKFGKKLEARELKRAAHMEETKVKIPTPSNKKAQRRVFSEKEKILYAVRFKKLGVSVEKGAKQLGLTETALRRWVKDFNELRPQQKAAASIAAHGTISDKTKLEAIAAIDAGEPVVELAQKIGVHPDSIRNWYAKTGREFPNQWSVRARAKAKLFEGEPKNHRPQNIMDERAPEAVAEVEAGKLIADVAKGFGVMPGTIRNWWRAIKHNDKWPRQYGIAQRGKKHRTRGPQKKTLDRVSVREAVLSNSQVITAMEAAETQQVNGRAVPITTGKAMHDILVFLQLARDEWDKEIKAGNVRVDYAPMLYTMLALHRAGK